MLRDKLDICCVFQMSPVDCQTLLLPAYSQESDILLRSLIGAQNTILSEILQSFHNQEFADTGMTSITCQELIEEDLFES